MRSQLILHAAVCAADVERQGGAEVRMVILWASVCVLLISQELLGKGLIVCY